MSLLLLFNPSPDIPTTGNQITPLIMQGIQFNKPQINLAQPKVNLDYYQPRATIANLQQALNSETEDPLYDSDTYAYDSDTLAYDSDFALVKLPIIASIDVKQPVIYKLRKR